MTAQSPPPGPPCAANPRLWDLDQGSFPAALDAKTVCLLCPELAGCRQKVMEMVKAGTPPQSMIWAAVAYRHDGKAIPTDRALRAYFNRADGQRDANRGVAA